MHVHWALQIYIWARVSIVTHRVLFRWCCRYCCSSSQHDLKSKNICTYIGVFAWKPDNSTDQLMTAIFNMRYFAPFPRHFRWHVRAEASNQLNYNNLLHSRWTVMRAATRQMCLSPSFSSSCPGNPFEPINAVLHFSRLSCTCTACDLIRKANLLVFVVWRQNRSIKWKKTTKGKK